MNKVDIDNVVVGAILASPVYYNGVLLCAEGTPISISLKSALKKFGIKDIYVNSIFTESIDANMLNFEKIDKFTLLAVKRLNIDDIILCAKELTRNLVNERYNTLLNVVFESDSETYNHSLNVANLAVSVGISMGLSANELRILAAGSLLHDIGKSQIDSRIISKPGKLTEEEYEIIKKHPELGFHMLEQYDVENAIKQIVYQHHEDWDGSGYPRQLFGTTSYRLARLVHIVDVYEALCAKRPYKNPMPRKIVRDFMVSNAGKKFDPILVRKFLDTIPMYMVGEEIQEFDRLGLVCSNEDKDNPTIFSAGQLYKLSEFVVISEEREAETRESITRLLKEE